MNIIKNYYFCTPIYFDEKKEWVSDLNKFTDPYISITKNKNLCNNNKDFAIVHHSNELTLDPNFTEFIKYINTTAFNILDNQGFDMTQYSLVTSECWVQEFASLGGGNHSPHTHWNGHISGFYFLKCSEKTSIPVFHDPRLLKKMNLLKEKESTQITEATSLINFKPTEGTFMFFNSYLEHEFTVDHGIDPFRFIHFNIQAVPKQLINNNIKRIST